MYKSIFVFLFSFASFSGFGQINLTGSLRIKDNWDAMSFFEIGNHLYYLKVNMGTLVDGYWRTAEGVLIKIDKQSFMAVDSVVIAGDTVQTDSALSTIKNYAIYADGCFHFSLTHAIKKGPSSRQINVYYTKVDTALNIQVPLTRIDTQVNSRAIVALPNNKILMVNNRMTPFQTNTFPLYHILNAAGNIVARDTFSHTSVLPASFNLFDVSDVQVLSPNRYFVTGKGLTSYALMGHTVVDSSMTIVDTFELNYHYLFNGQSGGYLQVEPYIAKLPSGDIVGASTYDDGVSTARAAIFKLKPSARYKIQGGNLYPLKDQLDVSFGSTNSSHSLEYNPFDNRLYYAATTHQQYQGFTCDASDNYIQVICLDTNLNTLWRKFIYSGPNTCAQVTMVRAPHTAGGIMVGGIRDRNLGMAHEYPGFLYRLDSAGAATSVANGKQMDVRNRIILYPNPVSDVLNIDDVLHGLGSIQIYSSEGKVVYHADDVQNGRLSVSTAGFPAGLYLARVTTRDNETVLLRFSKQ